MGEQVLQLPGARRAALPHRVEVAVPSHATENASNLAVTGFLESVVDDRNKTSM